MQYLWLLVLRRQTKRCSVKRDQEARELPLPSSASTSQPPSATASHSADTSSHILPVLLNSVKLQLSHEQARFSSVQLPKCCKPHLWPRDRSMLGDKCRTLNPVFSSFKVSTCLWLEPPLRWRSHQWFQSIDCKLPLQTNSSVKGISLEVSRKNLKQLQKKGGPRTAKTPKYIALQKPHKAATWQFPQTYRYL